jgi:hypothetical protein
VAVERGHAEPLALPVVWVAIIVLFGVLKPASS